MHKSKSNPQTKPNGYERVKFVKIFAKLQNLLIKNTLFIKYKIKIPKPINKGYENHHNRMHNNKSVEKYVPGPTWRMITHNQEKLNDTETTI